MSNLVIEQTKSGAKYCRNSSAQRLALQSKLLEYYGFKGKHNMVACVFPSGMTSISAIMNVTALNPYVGKTIFVIGDELYCDTEKVCKYQTQYNNEFSYEQVNVQQMDKIQELFKKYGAEIKLFFIETCTNPSGQMFDFSKLKELKLLAPKCIVVVDNTWVSGCSFNPFEYGADCVIESMTKYISGGTCIGGMMIGRKDIMDKVTNYSKINGLFVGSDHCELFLNGMSTIKQRIANVSKLTITVADYLENKQEVSRVMYPLLKSHPTYEIASKYLKYGPGIIWFHMVSTIEKMSIVHKLLSDNKYLSYETSYGSPHSKIDQWPVLGKGFLYDNNNFENNKDGIWIRLSIGYESDINIIIKGLEEIFSKNSQLNKNIKI